MTTTEREKTWEELMAEAGDGQTAPESYLKEGDIVQKPTAENPTASRVSELRFKGYVQVWDTVTGVLSLQPQNLLWQTLAKVREDGSKVFTLKDPHIPQNHGQDLFCYLNPAHAEWPRYQAMGFRPCKKRHIPHEDALLRHVKSSHKRAWAAITQDRTNKERQEDRDLQRTTMQALQALAASQRPQAAPVAPETAPTATVVARRGVTLDCDACAEKVTALTVSAAKNKLKAHRKVHTA